jgi:hypothetical protein
MAIEPIVTGRMECGQMRRCRMLKKSVSKAAGEQEPEAYPLGYVEDSCKLRTKLADFFSILRARREWEDCSAYLFHCCDILPGRSG